MEIPGVSNIYLLKAALNAIRKHRGEPALDAMDFLALVKDKLKLMEMDPSLLYRSVIQRRFFWWRKEAQRDPADGGAATRGSPSRTRPTLAWTSTRSKSSPTASTRCAVPSEPSCWSTHYQRLLNYIVPDLVHVMAQGRHRESGGRELALELESRGLLDRHAGSQPSGGRTMSATALEHYLAEFTRVEAIPCPVGACPG